ncbi:MAG TPA: AI-2E family transporter [Erysipelotrichaceae bacterium]|nr:AI-2E family transporter [Erysipelotrichaceae bacterium]
MKINTIKMKKAMFLIFFTIFTWWVFANIKVVINIIKITFEVLLPFIIAFSIAFILNKPMSFIEDKILKRSKKYENLKLKYQRIISLLLTLTITLLGVILFLIIVIPNLTEAVTELANQVPVYFESLQDYAKNNFIAGTSINEWLQSVNIDGLLKNITDFLKGGFMNVLGSTFGIFTSAFGLITSIFLGFVFSIYFLLQKEELILSVKKLTFATLPLDVANRLVYLSEISKESFSSFITGQSLDALLIGLIFFVSMLIFRFPYALMVSVIIGVFALIPIVGGFIGLVIGAFLIFVQDPQKALYFILLFFVIQQLEGDLIYPKVVGEASGLSSVWVLAAVALGGSLFGIIGIILFVPLFSIIQKLLKEYIDNNLDEEVLK